MYRTFLTFLVFIQLAGCAGPGLPPHTLADTAVNYNLKAPVGYETWSTEHQQAWVQIATKLNESRNNYDRSLNELRKPFQEKKRKLSEEIKLSEEQIAQLKNNTSRSDEENKYLITLEKHLPQLRTQFARHDKTYEAAFKQLIEAFKQKLSKLNILISQFTSKVADSAKGGGEEGGSTPSEEPPPVIFGEEIDPTTLAGYEAFLNIGGVAGSGLEDTAQASLIAGYEKLGFRVNLINDAMSWDPMQQRMAYVSSVYQQNNVELKYVVFHHGGHGWKDKIKYESREKDALGKYTKERGTPTPHQTIFNTLGSTFPKTIAQFPNTIFGVVLDACAQGNAVDRTVSGREGFVATATPAIRWYHMYGESYYYSGTYIYSNFFGNYLQQIDSIDDPHVKTEVLRNAHNFANEQSASSLMGNGEYKKY